MVEIWNIMDSIFLLTLFWQIRNRKLRKSKRKCNEKQNGKQTKIKENYLIIINNGSGETRRSHSTNETENKPLNYRQILSYH